VDLNGKTALITGGARFGPAVAEALAAKGCAVAVSYHTSKTAALDTAHRVEALKVSALAVEADLRRDKDIDALIETVDKTFGRLDVLIHMASVYMETPLEDLSSVSSTGEGPWRESLDVHLNAAYRLSLLAAPLMRRNGGGRIVHFADWTSASGRPRYGARLPYYVFKSGVKALTEALALELAPDIIVNAVAPGPILPPEGLPAEEAEEVVTHTPLKRWGGADEIAKAVLFLVDSDFVTGECLRVDGGRHLY
jgi:NAD(P)-dependent dehydrogenase (short-subunit alcohol dehydrogenase family)